MRLLFRVHELLLNKANFKYSIRNGMAAKEAMEGLALLFYKAGLSEIRLDRSEYWPAFWWRENVDDKPKKIKKVKTKPKRKTITVTDAFKKVPLDSLRSRPSNP